MAGRGRVILQVWAGWNDGCNFVINFWCKEEAYTNIFVRSWRHWHRKAILKYVKTWICTGTITEMNQVCVHRLLYLRWCVKLDWCLFTIMKAYNIIYIIYIKTVNFRLKLGCIQCGTNNISGCTKIKNKIAKPCFPGSLF